MAALVSPGAPDDYQGQFCGGSLIAPDRVLTAAHCVLGVSPSQVAVVVGRKRLTGTGGQRIAASGIAVNPSYDPDTSQRDAALVLLSASAAPADTPIGLVQPTPSSDDALWSPGTNLTVAGWGSTTSNGATYPDDLQQGTISRRPDAICATAYSDTAAGFDAASELCAAAPTTDSCFGDSGGPLFTQGGTPLEVGIVSFGSDKCLDPVHPGVYTRLGAPSVHTFVTSGTPVIQPFATANPSIAPAPVVGAASTCAGAQFGGSPARRQAFAWGRRSGDTITTVSSAQAYTPSFADLGSQLVCAVAAINDGGYGNAQSAPSPQVIAGPASPQGPLPPSTPSLPTTPTAPRDQAAPRAVLVNRSCARRRCTVVVAVTDAAPSAGIVGVTATLTTAAKPHCPAARRRCKKPRARRLAARRTAPDRFTIKTGRLKRGRYKLAVSALDAAGNLQAVPTRVTLSVR
jgi:hypothetical protein